MKKPLLYYTFSEDEIITIIKKHIGIKTGNFEWFVSDNFGFTGCNVTTKEKVKDNE
jgi:hypothetical protein